MSGGHGHDSAHSLLGVGPIRSILIFAFAVIFVFFIDTKGAENKAKDEAEAAAKVAARQAAQAAAPTAPPAVPQVRVVQPDCHTPCTMYIKKLTDLYSDGEPIWALPPDWPKEKAIRYEGKGHLVVRGGNIHAGNWTFWADNDKDVLIRPFEAMQ